MKEWIKKITDFVKFDVWKKEDTGDNQKGLWLIRQTRILVYTAKGVGKHGSIIRSAALTFYTVMALVPIVALAFGIIKALGMDGNLIVYLTSNFPDYADVIRSVVSFADNVIENTRRGGNSIATITGIIFLLWATVRVFSNIESAFNTIWEVKKQRTLGRKIGAYAVVLFVIPLFLTSVNFIISLAKGAIDSVLPNNTVLYSLGMMAIVWIIFTVVYTFVPNTKVKFRHSAMSALIASVAFMIFQFIYIYIQSGVNAYSIIYGSFASIPLFLLWVQVSWQILLFGGELSFSYQNIRNYMQDLDIISISYDSRRKITIAALYVIIRDFESEGGGITSREIADELNLPVRIIRDVTYDLENAGLIIGARVGKTDKVNVYLPARDINSIYLYDALQTVENFGTHINEERCNTHMRCVSEILEKIKKQASESDLNIPLIKLEIDENCHCG